MPQHMTCLPVDLGVISDVFIYLFRYLYTYKVKKVAGLLFPFAQMYLSIT